MKKLFEQRSKRFRLEKNFFQGAEFLKAKNGGGVHPRAEGSGMGGKVSRHFVTGLRFLSQGEGEKGAMGTPMNRRGKGERRKGDNDKVKVGGKG